MSVASGIRPYRGENGMYTELEDKYGMPVEQLLTAQSFWKEPELFWTYWKDMAATIGDVQPNAGHYSLASIAKKTSFLEITQNVDGLSMVAGIDPSAIVELHGTAHAYRCSRCGVAHAVKVTPDMEVPRCKSCGQPENAPIRPNIVMFNENIKSDHYKRGFLAAKNTDVLLLIGTTLQFGYLMDFVHASLTTSACVVLIDPSAENSAFCDIALPMTAVDGLAIIDQCLDGSVTTKAEFITKFRDAINDRRNNPQ